MALSSPESGKMRKWYFFPTGMSHRLKNRTSSVRGTFGLCPMMDTSTVRDCATWSAKAKSVGIHHSTLFRATSCPTLAAGAECHPVSEAICSAAGIRGCVRYARWLNQGGGQDIVVRNNQSH